MARRGMGSRSRRPRRRQSRRDGAVATVSASLAVMVIVYLSVRWLADHPGVLVVLTGTVVVAVGIIAWLRGQALARGRERQRILTASVEATDGLTGPQFEQWTAALMRRTGCRGVTVRGGSGDLGADIVATADQGLRVVVQCKGWRADRAVGSPDVQRFAGTARTLHGADVAVLVTTGRFSQPAIAAAARLGITLVDREALARWAADGRVPW